MLRALVEFRIRGVKVLILFGSTLDVSLILSSRPTSRSCSVSSLMILSFMVKLGLRFVLWLGQGLYYCSFHFQFIDDTPELFKLVQSQNRAQKVLAYLGDLAVNGSGIKGQLVRRPQSALFLVIGSISSRENRDSPMRPSFRSSPIAKIPMALLSMHLSPANKVGETSSWSMVQLVSPRPYVSTRVY